MRPLEAVVIIKAAKEEVRWSSIKSVQSVLGGGREQMVESNNHDATVCFPLQSESF